MAKRFVLFALLWLSVTILGYTGGRDELVKTYRKHIGVRELTGNNDGKEVEAFLASTGLGKGYAWCAAFVTYCHIENGIAIPQKASAWSPSWFPKQRLIDPENSLPGDVFGIYYTNLKRIGHVGFIDETWNNDSSNIITVEGNTNGDGSREGDGVYRKRRSKKQIKSVSRWIQE
jgi:hypothetical protein